MDPQYFLPCYYLSDFLRREKTRIEIYVKYTLAIIFMYILHCL